MSDALAGTLPVPFTCKVRWQIMKKIISAAALAAASLCLATPAAHAAPAPNPAEALTTAENAVAGFTAVLPDPPKSQFDTATGIFFGLAKGPLK
ncbi:hypothetical protein [Streptomyces syringium]|uniref:Uncharacterized protein n=1 Tax=Streptomyces syringium TaxID=76729 RepID=A0ABS4Y5P3_9ACTN|nr:hypothetical protein [Streptomyces syringium]MBP2404094.1 hypothetical protein [Streptomyces syringium]